jgi:hypothetical protein
MEKTGRAALKLSCEQFAFLHAAIENGARNRSADHGCVKLGFGVGSLPFGLHERTLGPRDFLHTWSDLRQLIALLQRMDALLTCPILCRRIIERLLRHDSFVKQLLDALQGDLVIGCCSPCFAEVVLGLLDLFRPRTMLQLQ